MVKPWLSAALALIVLFSPLFPIPSAQAQPAALPRTDIIPGELVIGLLPGRSASALSLPKGVQLQPAAAELVPLNVSVLQVPAGEEEQVRQELLRSPGVVFAEPNYRVEAADVIPTDPLWGPSEYTSEGQWGPVAVRAPAAWEITTGSEDITIAVLDSGLDRSHPEFTDRLLPGYDFISNDTNPQDRCGHGTHVAGIAAASANNGIGIAGMAWKAKILPVRVLDNECSGSLVSVARGIVFAVDHYGAEVINLSLGTSIASRLLETATYYAYQRGSTLIAAAGNSQTGGGAVLYPAKYPWVIAVAAVNRGNTPALYSNIGSELDVAAPGTRVLSTTPTSGSFYYQNFYDIKNRYGWLSGTSMAAPHVSGLAALLLSLPQFDHPDKVYAALTSTALDIGMAGVDPETGYGLIQADLALAYDPSSVTPPEPPDPLVEYDYLDSTRCANYPYAWREITHETFGNQLPIFGGDGYANVTLPFAFPFGGTSYTSLSVNADGYIAFDGRNGFNQNFIIPTASSTYPYTAPNAFIAAFWDDLNPSAGLEAGIFAQVLGTAPNREYVVEWYRIPIQANNTRTELTFQVVLFEGSGDILLQYAQLKGPGSTGASATIGVEYNSGYSGVQYAYEQPGAMREKQALRFSSRAPGTPRANECFLSDSLDAAGGEVSLEPFCLQVPAGMLDEPTRVTFSLLSKFPPVPADYRPLGRFADITLQPMPNPPFDPAPQVCYQYTAADVAAAGGRAANLYFAVYDSETHFWKRLPTRVDGAQNRIWADVPHFSVFGVFSAPLPKNLPVTGAPFPLAEGLGTAAGLVLILGVGLRWRRRPRL